MQFWIGTSGFQYPEWKGGFYPATLPVKQMLPYYAERFTSTESNYSFRHIPSAKTIAAWAAATPVRFKFSFKAPQRVTHFAKLRDCAEVLGVFRDAIAPMGAKLGAVLFQLPPTFKKDAVLLASFLDELPAGLRAAFEFRHASWFDDEVFACLRAHQAALCLAENEELATPAEATAQFGYLRLRREDYRRADLAKWAELVRAQAQWSEVFVYFKHEERGVGPKFARTFSELLDA
jgi:uncharacterized protein YecE (DUF72 family)